MARRTKQDDDGLTRRELFKGLGAGAVVSGLVAGIGERPRSASAAPHAARLLGPAAVPLQLEVNGAPRSLSVEPRATLLDVLREELDLTGAKPVCDRGACGACTVLLDGAPVCACMMLALDTDGRKVTTVEGLARGDELSALQRAFVEHDALQCGFCTPGMLMSCSALLTRNAHPTADDVRHAIAGNLCRCGTYPKVLEATLAAASSAQKGAGR